VVPRVPPQSPEGLWILYQSALGQVSMQADSTRPYQPIIHFNDTIEGDPGRLRLSQGASLKPDESESCSLVSSQRKVTGDGSGVEILNERVMEVWSRGGREMVAEVELRQGRPMNRVLTETEAENK